MNGDKYYIFIIYLYYVYTVLYNTVAQKIWCYKIYPKNIVIFTKLFSYYKNIFNVIKKIKVDKN